MVKNTVFSYKMEKNIGDLWKLTQSLNLIYPFNFFNNYNNCNNTFVYQCISTKQSIKQHVF